VIGEPLDVLVELIGMEPLDHPDDTSVQLTALLPEQVAVRHLVGQSMLEGVLEVREQARLVKELGALEVGEATTKVGFVLFGNRLQECERYVVADHGGSLEESLLGDGQSVDASGQDRLDAGRNLEGVRGLGDEVGAGPPDQHLRLDQGSDTFLEEEWVPFGSLDQQALEFVKRGIGTE
jgi:hypothetical protein